MKTDRKSSSGSSRKDGHPWEKLERSEFHFHVRSFTLLARSLVRATLIWLLLAASSRAQCSIGAGVCVRRTDTSIVEIYCNGWPGSWPGRLDS
jgi:hypothetical protein